MVAGGKIQLWDVRRGRPLPSPDSPAVGSIEALAWSPDGKTLAACSSFAPAVVLWDMPGGRHWRALHGDDDGARGLHSLQWSPDNKRLIVTSEQAVQILDCATEETLASIDDDRNNYRVRRASAWSPDGKTIATLSEGSELKLWDGETYRPAGSLQAPHGGTTRLAWSPDSQRLAVGGREGASVVAAAAGKVEFEIAGPRFHRADVSALAWSNDGRQLFCATREGSLLATDVNTRKESWQSAARQGSESFRVAMSADGRQCATASNGDHLLIWDHGAARLTRDCGEVFAQINDLAWSESGLLAAAGSGGVKLWDTRARHEPRGCPVQEEIRCLAWLPGGDTLALGSCGGGIRLWKPAGASPPAELFKAKSLVRRLAWSKDGARLAAGLEDNQVLVLESSSGRLLKTLTHSTHSGGITVLLWLDDGGLMATSWQGGNTTIWDADSGQTRLGPLRLADYVFMAAPAGPATTLALVTNRNVMFWDRGPQASAMALGAATNYAGDWLHDLGCSPALGNLVVPLRDRIGIYDLAQRRLLGSHLVWSGEDYMFVSPEGHWCGSPDIEDKLIYVARTAEGRQTTFSSAEFADRFGWKNDAEKVKLTGSR